MAGEIRSAPVADLEPRHRPVYPVQAAAAHDGPGPVEEQLEHEIPPFQKGARARRTFVSSTSRGDASTGAGDSGFVLDERRLGAWCCRYRFLLGVTTMRPPNCWLVKYARPLFSWWLLSFLTKSTIVVSTHTPPESRMTFATRYMPASEVDSVSTVIFWDLMPNLSAK